MANDLSINPWMIDTASGTNVTTDDLFIRAIKWNPGSAGVAGDQAIVQDKNGKEIWRGDAQGANGEFLLNPANAAMMGWKVAGLKVPTLGHGRLLIYFN